MILIASAFGCAGSSSSTSVQPPPKISENAPRPSAENTEKQNKPSTTLPVAKPSVVLELEAQGFSVEYDSKDSNGEQAAKIIESAKKTLVNNKDLFSKIKIYDYFEYDPRKRELHLSYDAILNQIEMKAVLEMDSFGKGLGNITIATPGLYPHMAWPKLKEKIASYTEKIRVRAKYIRHIETSNISDQYYPMSRVLAINEEWDASYLDAALKEVDQSKAFLDQLPNIRLSMQRGALSSSYDRGFETLHLLSASLKKLDETITKFKIESLGIEDALGLDCNFRLQSAKRELQIFAFTAEELKDGSCSVTDLLGKIDANLEFEASTHIKVTEEYLSMRTPNQLGPSKESIKNLRSLRPYLIEKANMIKEVRFSENFHGDKLCELKNEILFLTKRNLELSTARACIQGL